METKIKINEIDITDLYKKHFKDFYNPDWDNHDEIIEIKKTLVGSIFVTAIVMKENSSYCDYIEPGMIDLLKTFYDFFDNLERKFKGQRVDIED
jgi:hypothetical protein